MAMTPDATRIGFVGLGNLGLPMALALLDGSWSVTVLDRSPEKAEACRDAGAGVAESLGDLVDCDALVLVVSDDEAVESLLMGPDGYLERSDGGFVIVHSTIMPETARALAEHARDRGIGFLDAPVSGGAARARDGELTVMVGGEAGDLDHARALLDTSASHVVPVGEAGAGAATKLANQLMLLSSLAGAYEAIELAEAYGVSVDRVLESVATGTGASWVSSNWGFFDDTARAYDQSRTPVRERPWSKDLFEVVAAARAADVPVPFAGVLSQLLAARVESHAAASSRHPRDGEEDGND